MALRYRRSRGVVTISKMLKQLPDDVRVSMATEFHRAGPQLVSRMQGKTPARTGALRRGISYRVLPKTLKLLVGLLGTKRGRAKLFYGIIQDLGRRAKVVQVRRFRAGGQRLYVKGQKAGGDLQTYQMNVPSMAGKRFVTGSMPDLRRTLGANLRSIWKRALQRYRGQPSE